MPASPPFQITPALLALSNEISTLLGRYQGLLSPPPQPKLRRENRIRTIQGSLAIEGNTATIEQVTAVLEGKRVLGPPRELREVENALRAYELSASLDPRSSRDLLRAHAVMMEGLIDDAGRWRRSNVGILRGTRVSHVAPKADRVPQLMADLFSFLRSGRAAPILLRACVFHYELEFIHPFSDGNGRMGRLWQHVILRSHDPVFEHVPVESLIKERQGDYYRTLEQSDRKGDSTPFLEFSLEALRDEMALLLAALRPAAPTAEHRLEHARATLGKDRFARKAYLALFPTLSSATASRDLQRGVETGLLEREGDKARATYRFVR